MHLDAILHRPLQEESVRCKPVDDALNYALRLHVRSWAQIEPVICTLTRQEPFPRL